MNQHKPSAEGCFKLILHSLGLETSNPNHHDGVRVEFEKNFAIEIQNQDSGQCRISARVCKLGHSLHVQERQLQKALGLFTELQDSAPEETSLAISNHDNCLRSVIDIPSAASNQPENTLDWLNRFINFSFAYKQTFIAFKDDL